jgi:hypothetical protein
MENKELLEKKIKKAISRGIKYLLNYRLRIIDEEKNKNVYDGGASILLSYLQGRYGIELGFEENCNNLVKCASNYMIEHPRPLFGYDYQENDLFNTNFLKDIYVQQYNQFPISQYIEKMEKYLQSGDGYISQLMPILDIFSQRQTRYLNVGLGLFGLMEKNYDKTTSHKGFKHLKKRVCKELLDIFHNKSNYDPIYLDTTKSYALFLLHLLGEDDKLDEDDELRFLGCLIKTQNGLGHWIHTDTFDNVNEINNTILTIFSVVNLLYYYNKLTDMNPNSNPNNNINNKNKKDFEILEEGFQGGFLTQNNLDNIFYGKMCRTSILEIFLLVILMMIFVFVMIKIYRNRNI